MVETVTIHHAGQSTTVELKPCRRCGKLPTAEDALKAVEYNWKTTKSCAVCGGMPKMYPQHALYHSVDCDGKGCFILCGTGVKDPTWTPEFAQVYSSGPAGTVEGVFHVECLKRVAPGIEIHPPLYS